MAIYGWKSAISGSWQTAKDWSPSAAPGASDTAVFNTPGHNAYTVTDAPTTSTIDVIGDQVTFNFAPPPPVATGVGETIYVSGGGNVTLAADSNLGAGLTIYVTGKGSFATAVAFNFSAYVGKGATLTGGGEAGGVTLAGGTMNGGTEVGGVIGYGTLNNYAATTHNYIEASGGTLVVTDSIYDPESSGMLIEAGATLEITNGITDLVSFKGTDGTLQLDKHIGSQGFLYGFQPGDRIDIAGTKVTSVTETNNLTLGEVMNVFHGATMLESFAMGTVFGTGANPVPAGAIGITNDHNGGSILSWLPQHTVGVAVTTGT